MSAHSLRLALLLGACLLGALLTAAAPDEVVAPPSLREFWTRWVEAKNTNADEDLDRVVRRYRSDAEIMLNVLLDDISRGEKQELHFEIRLLAWSLDRVENSERYIARARYVIDLDGFKRGRRSLAMGLWENCRELADTARDERSETAWDAAIQGFEDTSTAFAEVGDVEFQMFCHIENANLEFERQRYWHQGHQLLKVKALAAQLGYDDPAAQMATDGLRGIAERGIDLDKPAPASGSTPGGQAGPGGKGLTSFAIGSAPRSFQLEFLAPKKGLPNVELPSFQQPDQYQLWNQTYMDGQGPVDFDAQRSGLFQPDGKGWSLSRDGLESFSIDTNGDGEPEATFAASSTPARIELVTHTGKSWPIMVCTPGQTEQMFDASYNYAPVESGARIRFFPATYWEGDVLGETWQVFDCNADGQFGVTRDWTGDPVTDYDADDILFFEPDGVLIGRSKRVIPFSSVLPVGETFYRVTPDSSRGTVTLQEMNLATGEVLLDFDSKVAPSHVILRETSGALDGAYIDVVPERRGKGVAVPVGVWQVCLGRISKGSKTSQDQVRIYTGKTQPFKVEAGKTVTLEMGAPYTLDFRTRRSGDELLLDSRTLRVYGRAGEEYAMFFDDPLQPNLEVRDSDGKKVGKPSKMRRVGVGEWQTNTGADNILWFPLEQSVPVSPGQTLELRLEQKAHSLLGGPLQSDWIR